MRRIDVYIKSVGKNAKVYRAVNDYEFLKLLEDLEYFKSEGLAREVVKEVFALKDNEVFKVLKHSFSKKELLYDFENEEK
jgi:hypothetical protein